jgi:hypothetical protein
VLAIWWRLRSPVMQDGHDLVAAPLAMQDRANRVEAAAALDGDGFSDWRARLPAAVACVSGSRTRP